MTRAEKVRKHCEQFDARESDGTTVMVATFDETDPVEVGLAIVEVSALMQAESSQQIEITATQLESLLIAMEDE